VDNLGANGLSASDLYSKPERKRKKRKRKAQEEKKEERVLRHGIVDSRPTFDPMAEYQASKVEHWREATLKGGGRARAR
jgi:hypothetical protein